MPTAPHKPQTETADFVVIGGGVIGLTVALELRARHPRASIVILEKEERCGAHASGRNSGVIHAGFYYAKDSLKAALCRDGHDRMLAWCDAAGARVRRCGKLVVARDASEHAGLEELARRARASGVEVHLVDEGEARDLEPFARTAGRALFAPSSAVVDPSEVMETLVREARLARIDIRCGEAWPSPIEAGYTVNAAGLYADRIARAFGFGERYVILPFKGLYLYGSDAAPPLTRHVYPVPDLEMPFLGVHFTVTVDGRTKIGPTAFVAPWREAYRGLSRFDAREVAQVVKGGLALLADRSFRRHAVREAGKLSRRRLVRQARALVPEARLRDFTRWGRPGIRAQLFDTRRRELVMDFHFEGDEKSLHILNAVSPAFTSAFAFASLVVDEIERQTR